MILDKLKASALILFLCAVPFASTIDLSKLAVLFKDMDGTPTGQQWRQLAFEIQNNSSTSIDISKIKLIYSFTETNNQISSAVWYYNVRSADWSIQGGQINEVTPSITYFSKPPNTKGNRELVLQFTSPEHSGEWDCRNSNGPAQFRLEQC